MTREEYLLDETMGRSHGGAEFFDYLRVMFKHGWMIVSASLLAFLITGILSFLQPPRYAARASVVPPVQLRGGDAGLARGLLGGAEAALLRNVINTDSIADLYVGILESRAVVDAIVDRFDLMQVYETEGRRYLARRRLKTNTDIEVSEEGIIDVTVEDEDPNRAAAIANAYIEQLDKQNKKLSVGQATSRRMFLENRLSEVEQKLRDFENLPAREAQVQEVLYELLVREFELAKFEEAKSMPTIQVLDAAVPPETRMGRGTVKKAVVAGVIAFSFVVFVAFAREYLAACRAREQAAGRVDADSLARPVGLPRGIPSGSPVSRPAPQVPVRRPVKDSVASVGH
jgi:uncharacterized protein involved in exopolysaccharide biosynthesis